MTALQALWQRLGPVSTRPARRELLRAALGAGLGMAIVGLLAWADRFAHTGLLFLFAPLGATAVLVFAVPSSPLAQPWNCVVGNTLSALWTLTLLHLAPTMPLFAPMPQDPPLARLCKAFLRAPSIQATPQQWADQLHKSLRTFTRLFSQQTGMSFGAWRQQACLLAALPRLSAGQAITQVALDLGYDSPSAFSTMFRKRLGQAPSDFIRAPAP